MKIPLSTNGNEQLRVAQVSLEGESIGDEIELEAREGGVYTIAVVGDGAGGEYEFAWEQAK